MVFYVVGDNSSVGMKRKKERMQKGTKMEKRMNAAALVTQCRSIGRNLKTGSSFNAAALGKRQKSEKVTESRMPQH